MGKKKGKKDSLTRGTNMKVVILTFSKEANRGANLQSYALYDFFKSRGIHVEFLDLQLPSPDYNIKGKIFTCLNNLLAGIFRKKQDFRFTRKYNSVGKLLESPPVADIFVVGSDQVWNPDITKRLDPLIYFLPFAKGKRVAYAASFGKSMWDPTPFDEEIKKQLHRFDAVSVRETSGITICKDTFGLNDAEVTLDPVLLLDSQQLMLIMGKLPPVRNEVFSYLLYTDTSLYSLIEKVTGSLSWKLTGNTRDSSKWKRAEDLYGIKTWLRKIYASGFIVTNSFHCMVCCILLRKNFLAVPPLPNRETRLICLLETLGLKNRYISTEEELNENRSLLTENIDYETVFYKLNAERKKSIQFLMNVVNRC